MSKQKSLLFADAIRVRDSCVCLHVQRAARALARRFDAALRPLGLTNGQFSLLMALNRPEAPTLGNVSALLAMNHATLTANLKPLERRGLIKVTVDSVDKRSRRATLTRAGRDLLVIALPVWERTNAETERCLSRCKAADLRAELRSLSQSGPPTKKKKCS
jgi:DNA-binding MarR family transcriptional regulator